MTTTEPPRLSENAQETLRARYLIKNERGEVTETPRQMFLRVARFVAEAESRYGGDVEATAETFYKLMARGIFLPNSPTLMNAGRSLGVLSACFVLPVNDSVDGIFESVKHTAQIQKAGGGTGFSFDRLRPTGDYIAGSGGRTSGPISFWRVFAEATRAIQQGAFRRGANMGMMSIYHPDILKFITAKSDLSAFENFNISVKVPDEFMERLRQDADAPHVVINPRTESSYYLPKGLNVASYTLADLAPADSGEPPTEAYTIGDVWGMIVSGAWDTGEPGVCFIDRVNADNPTPKLGRIEATNPCGEQPLLDYEACNLGSIDVAKFVRDGRLDEKAFRQTVRQAVRFLDDVIDVSNFIIPEIESICTGNRKIGLGVMGFADAMYELGIRYDSDEGLQFGRRVAKLLTENAFAASETLAAERGSFPNFEGSRWQVESNRPMRNAAVTCVAPTGTLSIIAGCTGGIEPAYALAFYRHVLEGRKLADVNAPFRRHAEEAGFWSQELADRLASGQKLSDQPGVDERTRELFVTAHDIAPIWHVRMQAVFQEYIDGAISKTINMPNHATVDDVAEVYQAAYDLDCKGVTVYRDGCRAGQPMATEADRPTRVCPQCRQEIPAEPSCARCPNCGYTLCT
ncbi:MAG: adenosylcobalamin-dependent ribonucleoside-diphosphate reductase [Phycisphaerae bacterium]